MKTKFDFDNLNNRHDTRGKNVVVKARSTNGMVSFRFVDPDGQLGQTLDYVLTMPEEDFKKIFSPAP